MRYDSGEIVVDGDARQLRVHGEAVHVSSKAFDLLCLLIENRPRALSKQQIHDRLWPDTFVGEASLPVLIREIRKALGRPGHDAIRTVHRFGYAFDGLPTTPASAVRMHVLRHAERDFHLIDGENIVGRDPAAQVCVASPSVSRHHAAIVTDGEHATIKDLRSKNGTLVDGRLINDCEPLLNGSVVTFGAVKMVYYCYDPDLLTESLHH